MRAILTFFGFENHTYIPYTADFTFVLSPALNFHSTMAIVQTKVCLDGGMMRKFEKFPGR